MHHAYECLEPCRACKGSGKLRIARPVGKKRKGRQGRRKLEERKCGPCDGSGFCRHEWRTDQPLSAPCQQPDCCVCQGVNPCGDELCKRCYFYEHPKVDAGPTYPCSEPGCPVCRDLPERQPGKLHVNKPPAAWACPFGACPRCGGLRVEWLSFDVDPVDVYLRCEVFVQNPARTIPGMLQGNMDVDPGSFKVLRKR